jgi:hypothetical protein
MLKNLKNRSLEDLLAQKIESSASALDWESILSFLPEKSWRPDTEFVRGGYNSGQTVQKHSSLIELWMSYHCKQDAKSVWRSFLEKIAVDFPDLSVSSVYRGFCEGLAKSYQSRGRFEAAGSEDLLRMWLSYQKDKIEDKLDPLLCASVELELEGLTEDLIKEGANPQKAIQYVRSRGMYNQLVKAGASTFEKVNVDPREEEPLFCAYQQTSQPKKMDETVYAFLLSKSNNEFSSSADRDSIVADMSRQRLKKTKAGQALSDEERHVILTDVILKGSKTKEVVDAVKKCLPEANEWLFEHEVYGKVSLPLFLSLKRSDSQTVMTEVSHRLKEDWFLEKTEDGTSAFEVLTRVKKFKRIHELTSDQMGKLKSSMNLDAALFVKNMHWLVEKDVVPFSPISNISGTGQRGSLDNAYDEVFDWDISRADFLTALKKFNEEKGTAWLKKMINKGESNYSYSYNDAFIHLSSWKAWAFDISFKEMKSVAGQEGMMLKVLMETSKDIGALKHTYGGDKEKEIQSLIKTFQSAMKDGLEDPSELVEIVRRQVSNATIMNRIQNEVEHASLVQTAALKPNTLKRVNKAL